MEVVVDVPLAGLSRQRPYPWFWWWSAVAFAGWQGGALVASLVRPERGLAIGCFNLGSDGAELGWPLWEYAWQANFWLFRFVPLGFDDVAGRGLRPRLLICWPPAGAGLGPVRA